MVTITMTVGESKYLPGHATVSAVWIPEWRARANATGHAWTWGNPHFGTQQITITVQPAAGGPPVSANDVRTIVQPTISAHNSGLNSHAKIELEIT
jgi:hypothetical protein